MGEPFAPDAVLRPDCPKPPRAMAFLLSEGAEPIPGYRLVRRLGTGGYGEVWQCTAPGGLTKAVKVIFGHMSDARAEQELRALTRIKEVRHPFLLSLERFEVIEDQLFIVTELADGSLMDRYEECRRSAVAGIPREELLGYMRDTADALDYMNEHYGLQHLDIKPQNLLVVAGRVKIADFGLVKELYGTSATATGGVTPLYASPEAFDGKVSRFSDQYSLAIVYQEMLTGFRPFPGRTTLQLAAQHMNSPPLLDPLPPRDRPVLARALAKVPDQRFPNCRDMVALLLKNDGGQPAVPAWQVPHRPAMAPGRTPPPRPDSLEPHDESVLAMDTIISAELPARVLRRPVPAPPREAARPVMVRRPGGKARLRPTLFLGIGGLAGATLRRLRLRLHQHFGDLAAVPIFRLLLLDTDRAGLWPSGQIAPGAALASEEALHVPLRRPDHYRSESRELLRWLDRRWLYGIPRSLLTEGMRPFGRLAFVDNAVDVAERVHDALALLAGPEARNETEAATGLALRGDTPRVFVVASIAGGTGSGMIVDLAYVVRQALAELHLSTKGLCGVLLHATTDDPTRRDLARVNAYATLSELAHFSGKEVAFPGEPRQGLQAARTGVPPFEECYLIHLGEQLAEHEAQAATNRVADYLFLDAASEAGEFLDQYRQSTHGPGGAPGGPLLRTLGVDRMTFPRLAVAERGADLLCQRLLELWQAGPTQATADGAVPAQPPPECVLALLPEALEDRLAAAAESAWGEEPEAFVGRVLAAGEPAPILLRRADELLGTGPGFTPAPRSAEILLRSEAEQAGADGGAEAVRWFVALANDPARRLGSVEESGRALLRSISSVAEETRARLAEAEGLRIELRALIAPDEQPTKAAPGRWLGIGRRPAPTDPAQRLVEYGRLRFRELVLTGTVEALRAAGRRVSEFLQEAALAKERLVHFKETFGLALSGMRTLLADGPPPPGVTELFPAGTKTRDQAAEELLERLGAGFVARFDEQIQAEILGPSGGLWTVLMRTRDLAEALTGDLQRRGQALLLEELKPVEAAGLLLAKHPESAAAEEDLLTHLQAATPRLAATSGWQHLVVAVPNGAAGASVQETVTRALPEVAATVVPTDGDVVFCYEAAHLPLAMLAGAVIEQEGTYAELARRVVTRIDVKWTRLPPPNAT